MRTSKSRSRGKRSNNNRYTGNIINRVFDSSGPEGKVRGTPQQIIEKYSQLHRDSQLSNDRVAAENFQQHAEHYARMLTQAQREQDEQREAAERCPPMHHEARRSGGAPPRAPTQDGFRQRLRRAGQEQEGLLDEGGAGFWLRPANVDDQDARQGQDDAIHERDVASGPQEDRTTCLTSPRLRHRDGGEPQGGTPAHHAPWT